MEFENVEQYHSVDSILTDMLGELLDYDFHIMGVERITLMKAEWYLMLEQECFAET